MFKKYLCAGAFLAIAAIAAGGPSAQAETAKEKCLKAAQVALAKCQKALPPNVTPKDRKKPTDAEKAGMLKYTQESKKCNDQGSKDALSCK